MALAGLLTAPASEAVAARSVQTSPPASQLILEVWINGVRAPMWWQFNHSSDRGLSATALRLRRLGLNLPESLDDAADVFLSDIPGMTFRYDEGRQVLEIDAEDAVLAPVVLDGGVAPTPIEFDKVDRNFGAVLNYGLYAAASDQGVHLTSQYDLRFLTRFGVASTAGYANWSDGDSGTVGHVRLDSNWRTVDIPRAIAWTVGDIIGDGGQLGGGYRLAGIQIRRDFDTRPDLVTTALPVLNGSAAVPSTLDLYVNGLRYFSGQVARGPFQFRSLPNVGGGATATIVLTDAGGRETRIERPVFFVPGLLPQGKLDFSLEAGFPRLRYGSVSFDYLDDFVASGSLRYGVNDNLTVLAHAETGPDVINGSLGLSMRLDRFGVITAGFASSRHDDHTGSRYLLQAQTRIRGVDLFASVEQADDEFDNIVTATAPGRLAPPPRVIMPIPETEIEPILSAFSRRTERFGANFSFAGTGFNLGYARVKLNEDYRIASFSAHRPLAPNLSLWGNAYQQFGDREDYGVMVGLSFTLNPRSWSSASVSSTSESTRMAARVNRNTGQGPGSWSWALAGDQVLSGEGESYYQADVRYRHSHATIGAGLGDNGGRVQADAYVEGAVALMDGLHLAPSIDWSFAVVRGAGADTPVMVDSRLVTTTDENGRAFIPSLRSLARNRISINPRDLPVDLRAATTEIEVTPDDRAGVIVDFGVAPEAAAVVILVGEDGQPLPLGSVAILDGAEATSVVGYDGRTYLTGLSLHNTIRVRRAAGSDCSAEFEFRPVSGQQVTIGPLTCR